ncbi:thiol:disulfide interchange protein precursor [compost metagenome]
MTGNIPFYVAFGAGVLSFLSPCVLPLVPGYLSFVSGVNMAAARTDGGVEANAHRREVVLSAAVFVLGFSLVFIALGASATAVGALVKSQAPLLSKLGGALLFLFGLHMTGLIPIKALYAEKRFQVANKPLGLAGALLVGMAFAFGWTPCIGPVLGGILTMAGAQESMYQGIALLAAYSAGLGLPFMATAFGITHFYSFFDGFKSHFRKVEIAGGVLLMAIGVLIFSGNLTLLANWIPFNFEELLTGS